MTEFNTQVYWQTMLTYGWHEGLSYLLLAALLMGLMLLRSAPDERQSLVSTLALLTFSVVGLLVSGLVAASGNREPAGYLREVFIIVEGLALIRLGGLFVFHVLLPQIRLSPPSILEDILVIIGYLLWGLSRLHEAGVELSSLVATSAVITAVIAFSMQDTLGNVLGGIALQLDSSIRKGDWIKVGDVVGKVVDIHWRSTSIETRNWETVVIPNSVLMKNNFIVLGRRQGEPLQWRRWVWFNVDYSVPPAKVIEVVQSALRQADIPNTTRRPRPNCVMMDFDTSTARYAVRYWLTDLAKDDPTDSMVRIHVYAALKRAGITLAQPQQTVHLIKESEKHEAHRHAQDVAQRQHILQQLELFSQLSEDELKLIAERLVFAPFAKGDVVTRQGAIAHWLYILTEGEVEVVLETKGQPRHVLGRIQAGEKGSFFGEMGLLTGEPRAATVMAATAVQCYRLDKAAFEGIIQARPAMAEEISLTTANRRMSLESARSNIDEETRRRIVAENQSEVLQKIRSFFRL